MKTVSYELALRLKEVAEKHGVVLPESYRCYYGKMSSYPVVPDNENTFGLRGFTVTNADTGEQISFSDDCNSTKAHTADELMDWFMAHKITIQIIIMNDQYAAVFHGNLSDPIAYSKNKNMFDKNIANDLALMAIWLIENGYVK